MATAGSPTPTRDLRTAPLSGTPFAQSATYDQRSDENTSQRVLNSSVQQIDAPLERAIPRPSGRLYRPLFVSPDDAVNPVDRLQVVQAANADDKTLITDAGLGKIEQAIKYLNQNNLARESLDRGLRGGVKIHINRDNRDYYHSEAIDPNYRVTDWDPESQIRLQNADRSFTDEYQSPAMGLGHEIDHFSRPDMPVPPGAPLAMSNEDRVRDEYETLSLELSASRRARTTSVFGIEQPIRVAAPRAYLTTKLNRS